MSTINFHKDFTLNGKGFDSADDLIAYSKKGSPGIHVFLVDWFDKDDFITVKTSGSTGKPKEIKLRKKHMIHSAEATGTYFHLPAKTTALLCLPLDYIAGKMMLVRALTLGWHMDSKAPDAYPLQHVEKIYDFAAMVPMQVYNSLNKLSKIRKLIVGGGAVSKELEAKLQGVSTHVFATYGMTETITHVAVKKLNHRHAELVSASHHYNTLPNVTVSKDDRGCLVIQAPEVADEVVATNDLVEIISSKEFKWLGRYDHIINSGGIKLIPEQIEKKISPIINHRFLVAGIPDEVLGEKLVIVIESEKSDTVILNEVKNLSSLTKYEIPKEIYFIPKFIETETKKIQRQKTLDLLVRKK